MWHALTDAQWWMIFPILPRTGYEKQAVNILASLKLAVVRLRLRVFEFTSLVAPAQLY